MTLKDSAKDLGTATSAPAPRQGSKSPRGSRSPVVTPVMLDNAAKRQWVKPEYKSINCGSEVTGYFYQA
ncbi:MAG: pyrroloquinoline quinone precursor peptide PqqA [Candidatus Obscuribacterales bacterium]|nr:pyrroloquinoline quinone precursor peptide PqqA [Candidatus Obscuribacterales bacterium]